MLQKIRTSIAALAVAGVLAMAPVMQADAATSITVCYKGVCVTIIVH